MSIGHWSKQNIDRLIQVKKKQMKEEKPDIQFLQHKRKQFKAKVARQ